MTDSSTEVPVTLIDCDVHPYLKHQDELRAYMVEPWRSKKFPNRREIYMPPGDGRRLDSFPAGGSPPGSDPDLMRQHVFEGIGVDYIILIPMCSTILSGKRPIVMDYP